MMSKSFKLTISFVLTMGFLLITVSGVYANERVQYETTSNSINLSWNVDAEYVKVFEGNKEKEFNYDNSSITIENLEPNTLYKLTLVYYDDNDDVISFDYLKLSTEPNNIQLFTSVA